MKRHSFRGFFEATDIFGFDRDRERPDQDPTDNLLTKPIKQFDVELMMDLLARKQIGAFEPKLDYMNEIRWGTQPGAIKLEIDTGYTFFIKKLAMDKSGNPRWYTKKSFQLNRQGYGGYEDAVAQEIFEELKRHADGGIATAPERYDELGDLANHIYSKIKRTCRDIFIPEGIKKLSDDAYILTFGVRGHGLEFRNQQRVEQNQTLVSYDNDQGTIRITNYNLLSGTGKAHEFKINQNDLDLYFFPSQSKDEISEPVAVFMKYY